MLFYRLLLSLLLPVFAVHLLRADGATRRARLGLSGPTAARRGQVIWLHAASNGEVTAARSMIKALQQADPGLTMLVTCNSASGRALVAGWNASGVVALAAPLDYRWAVNAFLAAWQPDALIIIENELWPNRIAAMARRNRPVLAVSARMSDRSAAIWRRFPGVARAVTGGLTQVWPQNSTAGARFRDLGLPGPRLNDPINLKLSTEVATPDAATLAPLAAVLPRGDTFLAASTHDGEDAPLIRGFHQAHQKDPALRMILAPRHPRRAASICALLNREGLAFAMRSDGALPDAETPVLLADTLGEMPLWYSLASVTFVGGSLVPKGGHTPIEPALFGSAILHGPHLENFAETYAQLHHAGGAIRVDTADALTRQLLARETLADTARAAETTINAMRGTLIVQPVLDALANLTGNAALRLIQKKK